MTDEQSAALRRPFPAEVVGKLPKPTKKDNPKGNCKECGGYHGLPAVHLDYVGHAEVTDRLLDVDPTWTWEPVAYDDASLPRIGRGAAGEQVLWIRLTVGGVTRLGVGSVPNGAFDSEKQLIGDALRNASMRFGVALDLWAKHGLESEIPEALPDGHSACPRGCGVTGDKESLRGHLVEMHDFYRHPDGSVTAHAPADPVKDDTRPFTEDE